MAELALGAVNSVLGRLSAVIRDEAQLLGSVRGEVQFIKDEMESMNGFLRHLAEADDDHDHQVRAWMKQVMDLAYDSRNCIDLYVQRVGELHGAKGLLGNVRRVPVLLCALVARHQIATQIKELKVRAREVGERRLRYGVTVPAKSAKRQAPEAGAGGEDDAAAEIDASKRDLVDAEPDILKDGTDELLQCLEEQPASDATFRVFAVLAPDSADGAELAQHVYEHPSTASLLKASLTVERPPFLTAILQELLEQLLHGTEETKDIDMWSKEQLEKKLQTYLEGKKFLIVLDGLDEELWKNIKTVFDNCRCAAGSAIIVPTPDEKLAQFISPAKTITYSLVDFFSKKASVLVPSIYDADDPQGVIRDILKKCCPDVFSMTIFIHALYVNPNRSKDELEKLHESLDSSESPSSNNAKKMLMLSYNELPPHYKSCLLYLTIYPPGHFVRRTSLVRRWVAEGLITRGDGPGSAADEAERCFDALLARGFVRRADIGVAGKVKACTVCDSVPGFITEIARKEYFVDTRLPPDLAWHFSIRSGIRLRRSDSIAKIFDSMPSSSRLHLLKVLDLEGCTGLGNSQLKNICKISLLKYLSLRKTDIEQLPKQINKLLQLETLDIRQTNIQSSSTKAVALPMLKRLFAGFTSCPSDDVIRAKETFFVARMPRNIRRMTNMEMLSHVKVSHNAEELKDVRQLRQLRKLGVVLYNNEDHLRHLLHAINELDCLHSLSIWFTTPGMNMGDTSTWVSHPPNLWSINISGITSGLLPWIEKLPKLVEVTLRGTSLSASDMKTLGAKLTHLRCLKLRYKSYVDSKLSFKKDDFRSLKFLVIEGSNITTISFEAEGTLKLEKIVWSFTSSSMSLSGISNLPRLKELQFNGGRIPDQVLQDIKKHKNHPIKFRHNLPQPQDQDQEAGRPQVAS